MTAVARAAAWLSAMLWRFRRWLAALLLGRRDEPPILAKFDTKGLPERLKRPGLECPRCGVLIVVDPIALVGGHAITCANPVCGLVLELDVSRSAESIDALGRHLRQLEALRGTASDDVSRILWTGDTARHPAAAESSARPGTPR